MANVTICEYELDQLHQSVQEKLNIIEEMREAVKELYSMRGEDELTARLCNQMLKRSQLIEIVN